MCVFRIKSASSDCIGCNFHRYKIIKHQIKKKSRNKCDGTTFNVASCCCVVTIELVLLFIVGGKCLAGCGWVSRARSVGGARLAAWQPGSLAAWQPGSCWPLATEFHQLTTRKQKVFEKPNPGFF